MTTGESLSPEVAFQEADVPDMQTSIDRFDIARHTFVNAFESFRVKPTLDNREYINDCGSVLSQAFRESVEYIIDNEKDADVQITQITSLLFGERKERVNFLRSVTGCEHPDNSEPDFKSIDFEQYVEDLNKEGKSVVSAKLTDDFIYHHVEDLEHFLEHIESRPETIRFNRNRNAIKNISAYVLNVGMVSLGVAGGIGLYHLVAKH